MDKGIVYVRKLDKSGWCRINLNTMTMDIIPALPFPEPKGSPITTKPLRGQLYHKHRPAKETFAELALFDAIRSFKGKIDDELYHTIWKNYAEANAKATREEDE